MTPHPTGLLWYADSSSSLWSNRNTSSAARWEFKVLLKQSCFLDNESLQKVISSTCPKNQFFFEFLQPGFLALSFRTEIPPAWGFGQKWKSKTVIEATNGSEQVWCRCWFGDPVSLAMILFCSKNLCGLAEDSSPIKEVLSAWYHWLGWWLATTGYYQFRQQGNITSTNTDCNTCHIIMLSQYSPVWWFILLKKVFGFILTILHRSTGGFYRVFHMEVSLQIKTRGKRFNPITPFLCCNFRVYFDMFNMFQIPCLGYFGGMTSQNRPLLVVGTLTCTNLRCEIFSGSKNSMSDMSDWQRREKWVGFYQGQGWLVGWFGYSLLISLAPKIRENSMPSIQQCRIQKRELVLVLRPASAYSTWQMIRKIALKFEMWETERNESSETCYLQTMHKILVITSSWKCQDQCTSSLHPLWAAIGENLVALAQHDFSFVCGVDIVQEAVDISTAALETSCPKGVWQAACHKSYTYI